MHLKTLTRSLCSLLGRRRKPPELGRALPADSRAAESVFNARVEGRFPRGTLETDLVAELKRQEFSVRSSENGEFATFSDGGFPIEKLWHVGWRASDGRITSAWGVYGFRGP